MMSATLTSTKCETSDWSVTHTNKLTPTPLVLSPSWLGRMDDEESRNKDMVIHINKEDESLVHISTTTPTSNERDSQGIDIGVGDAMFPFEDMMTFDYLHDMNDHIDMSHATLTTTCDTFVDHVESYSCDDIDVNMPCYSSFIFSMDDNWDTIEVSPPIACNEQHIYPSKCLARNDIYQTIDIEMTPIVFSNFGDSQYPHFENATHIHMHIHQTHNMNFIDTNGDVQKGRYIMMDDVYLYHAHTFFSMCNLCVGSNEHLPTSIEHELTKRALEGYQCMSPNACFTQGDPGTTSRLKSDINFMSSFLSYSHRCPMGLESRTTHLEGEGDDVVQPTSDKHDVEHMVTLTFPPKVNHFHSINSLGCCMNGSLLEPNAPYVARTPMDTQGPAKDVLEANTTKAEAWKRRRNRGCEAREAAAEASVGSGRIIRPERPG